jgi:RNA methyltransferase, TrmH family
MVAKDSAVVQRIRSLREPAARRAQAGYVAEGQTVVKRAIDDGLPVESVLYRSELVASADGVDIIRACARTGVACYRCSDGLMGTITGTRPLPAVIAAIHFALRDVAELRTTSSSVLLVAEDLQNPDNLGMVLRTADAGGAQALVVTSSGADPLHKNCVRAARGAVGRLPLYECGDLAGWLTHLAERGFAVVGAAARGDANLYDQVLRPPLVIVVGNEETGLSPLTLAACTSRVRIPMAAGQSSLNVAVASGVLLFEFVRQRGCR